jgi:hypothetical protein
MYQQLPANLLNYALTARTRISNSVIRLPTVDVDSFIGPKYNAVTVHLDFKFPSTRLERSRSQTSKREHGGGLSDKGPSNLNPRGDFLLVLCSRNRTSQFLGQNQLSGDPTTQGCGDPCAKKVNCLQPRPSELGLGADPKNPLSSRHFIDSSNPGALVSNAQIALGA